MFTCMLLVIYSAVEEDFGKNAFLLLLFQCPLFWLDAPLPALLSAWFHTSVYLLCQASSIAAAFSSFQLMWETSS